MFKKGLKRFFLVFCLMVMSSIVFVACEKTKVKVSSIAFRETESVTMIVGQTYTPDVSVSPSYAANTDFYFEVQSNPDVIKISSKSIVALKEGVAQLKVISVDGGHENVIAVKVLPAAINLKSPSNLSFDGEKFTFSSVNYATNYFLSIKDSVSGINTEVELGNSTSYSLSQYQSEYSVSAFDTVLEVKVRAVGDERITVASGFSDSLSVLKISTPTDLRVENNVLKFTKVKNVSKYKLVFKTFKEELLTLDVLSSDYHNNEVTINIDYYKNLFEGGQYYAGLICSDEGYEKTAEEDVTPSEKTEISFDVLNSPKNLVISDYVLYWDSVVGAIGYTLYDNSGNILLDNIKSTNVNLKELGLTDGLHSYKLVANSDKTVNVVSGMNYSDTLTVSLLTKPSVSVADKTISWNDITGATTYNLIIYKDNDVVNNLNLIGNSYSVANFEEGDYEFKIYSCGDNVNTLTSLEYSAGTFTVLSTVSNLRVENEQILWDCDEGEKFGLKVFDSTSSDAYINEVLTVKNYDISNINFNSGEFTVEVLSLGENNVFNSKSSSTKFYKLSEIKDVTINDGLIEFSIDAKTDNTSVILYDINDKTKPINALNATGKNKYVVDESLLSAGLYEVEAFAYGNNGNILNADNNANTRFLQIRKLDTATLKVDKIEFNVLKDKSVDYASSYELYQNNSLVKTFEAGEEYKHNISTFGAGEYEFTIKALGNRKDVLDGEISAESVKVLKLDTPTLSLDKTSLIYTITTNEAQDRFVSGYNFVVNSESVDATSKTVDCASLFDNAGTYTAELRLVAGTSSEHDLIMDSDLTTNNVTKINSVSNLVLDKGQIIITPTTIGAEGRHNYSPTISIGYIESGDTEYTYIDYKEAVFDKDKAGFVFNIYDENYNVTGPRKPDGSFVFANAGIYDFKLKLERSGYITSNISNSGTITKLAKVGNIQKVSTANSNSNIAPDEKITFNSVSGATKYLLRIVQKEVPYVIELESGTTSITVDKIKTEFKKLEKPLSINGGNSYNLEFIAVGSDGEKIATAQVSDKFTMRLLKWPTLEITNNVLYVSDFTVAEKIYITCKDTNGVKYYKMLDISTPTLDLAKVSGLSAGNISISVKFESSNKNTFQSSARTTSYTQLEQPVLSVEDGLIKWASDDNARAYLLTYTIDGETNTLELSSGSENFSVSEGLASYELKGIEVGTSTISVKKLGKGWVEDSEGNGVYYYDSLASAESIIAKLSQPIVEVKNGQIFVSLNTADYSNNYIGKVTVNGADITKYSEFGQTMIIDGYELLNYNSETEIEEEVFTISIQAKTVEGKFILNANDYSFSVKGLKVATGVAIKTDYDPATEEIETIDSINWTPNHLNEGLISGYVIEIVYNQEIYTFNVGDAKQTELTFPTHEDFGAGKYSIFVKTLTDTVGYVHSKLSEQLEVIVCEKPTKLRTNNGIVCWNKVDGATEYVVHLYDDADTLLDSVEVTTNEFDFNALPDYSAGVYKLRVFATNKNDNKTVSGVKSDVIEVLRLPEITKYKVIMGELYLYAHTFTSAIDITFTSKVDSKKVYNYQIKLQSANLEGDNWSSITELTTMLTQVAEDEKSIGYIYKKVEIKDSSILNMLDGRYLMEVKAIGNSTEVLEDETVAKLSTVNSKITSNTNNLINEYVVENVDTNYAQKMITPNAEIEDRGVISFGLDSTYVDCKYYNLNGMLIYDVALSVGDVDYSFYVIDYYYQDAVDDSMVHVYDSATENHTYYGYIKYEYETDKYLYLNILRYKASEDATTYTGELEIDFTKDMLYFVNKLGDKEEINLKQGGNFKVDIKTVGDNTVYLTSNLCETLSVVRYEQLDLNISQGYLTWKNLKTDGDDPIYLLKITDTNNETILVYVYDNNSTLNKEMLPEVVEGKTYFEPVNTIDSVIMYMLDTKNSDEEYVFSSGIYSVNLTTYYRDSTDKSKLESRQSIDKTIVKLESPDIEIKSGLLKWNQIKVDTENIENYQIFLSGGAITDTDGNLYDSITFKIGKYDYTVDVNGVISYLLPQNITDINGVEFIIDYTTKVYEVCVRAVEDIRFINSNDSEKIEFSISDYVSDLKMEDGKVVWNWGAENSEGLYEVKLEVYRKDGSLQTTCIISNVSVKSFVPNSSYIDIGGQSISITSETSYKIFVKRIGDNSSITGFYRDSVEVEKLKAVKDNSIKSVNGVLTWEAITSLSGEEMADISYVIEFVGTDLENVIVESDTKFDFVGYAAGNYTVRITPTTNNHFTGVTSSGVFVSKLDAVGAITNPSINNVNNILQWNAVSTEINGETVYADRYEVKITGSDGAVLLEHYVDDTEKTGIVQYSLAGESMLDLTVTVRAVMTTTGSVINAEWSEPISFTKAKAIEKEYFVINRDKIRFEWRAIEGEQTGDRYMLKFTYKELSNSPSSITDTRAISSYEMVNGVKTYYFIPDKIGYYTQIQVTVNRGGSLSSETIVMTEMVNGVEQVASYTFDKFASGQGVEGKPFIIETVDQLLNINLFPEKHYKLNNDIDMTGVGEMLITNEFSGTFNGNNKVIKNYSITSNEYVVGIFRALNGANIYDLNISYANIEITTNFNGQKIYTGILAGMTAGSTIINVNISMSLININCNDTSAIQDTENRKFYFGGMFGYSSATAITSCDVQIGYKDENSSNNYSGLTFIGWNQDYVYFGGVVGYGVNTQVVGNEGLSTVEVYYHLTIGRKEGVNSYPNVHVGGVFGAIDCSNASNLSITLNQNEECEGEISSHGGVAGYVYSVNGLTTFSNIQIGGKIYNDMCANTSDVYSKTSIDSSADPNITSANVTSILEIVTSLN